MIVTEYTECNGQFDVVLNLDIGLISHLHRLLSCDILYVVAQPDINDRKNTKMIFFIDIELFLK